jgi:beta-phosphoglucomutase
MKKLKALLFDLDGTLINSEIIHFDCWNEILEGYGIKLTYDTWMKNYAGIPLPAKAEKLIKNYNIKTPQAEIIRKKERMTIERLRAKNVDMMPYATEVLNYFSEKKLTLGLVTASSRADAEAIFERNELDRYFKVIITRSEVNKSKPDPESYNTCLDKLGVFKEECVVFEDTINGIKAAKAAGLLCFAIQSNILIHDELSMADQLFLNLKEAKEYLVKHY